MKASQLGWLVSALILATTIGCGKNGDPGKGKYDNLKKETTVSTQHGVPTPQTEQPKPVVPPLPPNVDCNHPITVSVDKPVGKDVLEFHENSQSTYQISVRSNRNPTNFEIQPVTTDANLNNDLHSGRAKFVKVSGQGPNAVYSLTWKPSSQRLTEASFVLLTLKYTDTGSTAICITQATAGLNLAVQPAKTGDKK